MANKGTSSSAKARNNKKPAASAQKKKNTSKRTVSGRKGTSGAAASKSKQTKSSSETKTRSGAKTRAASAGKKNGQKKYTGESAGSASSSVIYRDVFLICLVFLCLLLFISSLGFGGIVGKKFSSFFFGLFGTAGYAFPFVILFAVIFSIANRGKRRRTVKMIGYWLFYAFVCALLQIMMEGYRSNAEIMQFYVNSSYDHQGGGLTGGVIVYFLGKAFGIIGTYIVLFALLVISAIIMTQRPLVSEVKKRSDLARERVKETRLAAEESRKRLEQEKEAAQNNSRDPFSYSEEDNYDEEDSIDSSFLYDRDHSEMSNHRSGRKKTKIPSRKKHTVEEEKKIVYADLPRTGSDDLKQNRNAKRDEEYHQVSIFDLPEPIRNRNAGSDPDIEELFSSIPDETHSSAGTEQRTSCISQENPVSDHSRSENSNIPVSPSEESSFSDKKRRPARSSQEEIESGINKISEEIEKTVEQSEILKYQLPPLSLLKKGTGISRGDSSKHLKEQAKILQDTLADFGVSVQVTDVSCGPSVTRYELRPEHGVKVSRIVNLSDDIKLNLAASNIRIEAPIPGKSAVGIEVPNKTVAPVLLRDLIDTPEFRNHPSKIAFAVGKDIAGKTVIADIAKMPHLLIAGATGSGKSVCINTLIMSILFRAAPDEVKLLMIDPKVVELSVYNGIPHLAIPVVTDPKKAAGALNWAVAEMSDRYNRFAEIGVRDITNYNARIDHLTGVPSDERPKKMPQIVIIVDELADLMMAAPGEVEDAICRLAQLARAAGIHLIIATQRPSVNVVTGLIKANMPSRIALSVASGVDSRTILDMNGAEKLLGHGDMLFYPQGYNQPARVQGGFVSDDEITEIVTFLSNSSGEVTYDSSIEEKINSSSQKGADQGGSSDRDEYFIDAAKLIIDKDKASIGMLQRAFKIGFNRAARIMDQLCEAGVVGEEEGTKPRKILMSREQFENDMEDGRL